MCTSPLLALNYGVDKLTGKNLVKFRRVPIGLSLADVYQEVGKKNVMLIPCGSCLECKMKYRKEWALRCTCEALSYGDNNCFVTLTYDESHCPEKLVKRDLKLFFRSLARKKIKFRYFACGEYGDHTHRPHFHVILFGYKPSDMKLDYTTRDGFGSYISKILNDCWKRGHVVVMDFAPQNASYVAGYVNKKVGDDDGFIVMSRRPGIGYLFYEENKLKLLEYDNFIMNGVHSLPRFYMKLLEKDGFDLARLKDNRKEQALSSFNSQLHSHSVSNLEEVYMSRRIASEQHLKNVMKRNCL